MPADFLTRDDILRIHRDQIERHGGSLGVRDEGLLDSAIAMPAAVFGGQYLHPDVVEMAAAYAFHLVSNHPFIDGNKRAGAVAAAVFLLLNGWELVASQDDYYRLILGVARGTLGKPAVIEFFRAHSHLR